MKLQHAFIPLAFVALAAIFTKDLITLATIGALSLLTQHLIIINRLSRTMSDTALSISTILTTTQTDALTTRALLQTTTSDTAAQLAARARIADYKDPVLQELGDAAMTAMRRTIPTFSYRHIEHRGEFLIAESYALLWQHLIVLQKNAPPDKPLHVKTTHFAPFDVWFTGRGTQYMDLQIEFLAQGGKLTQIYLASDMTTAHLTPETVLDQIVDHGGTIYKLDFAKIAVLALQVPNFLLLDDICAYHWVGLLEPKATRVYAPSAPQYEDFQRYWRQLTQICTNHTPYAPASRPRHQHQALPAQPSA